MQCIYCCVRLYNRFFYTQPKLKKQVSSSHLPWMWIGAQLPDGSMKTLTELVDISVEYGDCVTSEFLEAITEIDNAVRWVYLDSKTLKEEEIPTEGLIIEDDSVE